MLAVQGAPVHRHCAIERFKAAEKIAANVLVSRLTPWDGAEAMAPMDQLLEEPLARPWQAGTDGHFMHKTTLPSAGRIGVVPGC